MTDDRIDQRLRELARDYHRPPAVPREELWARIVAERARRRAAPRVLALRPWLRWGLAAAAVLVLGIALGRLTAPVGSSPRRRTAPASWPTGSRRRST